MKLLKDLLLFFVVAAITFGLIGVRGYEQLEADFTSSFNFVIGISPLYWLIIFICVSIVWAAVGLYIGFGEDTSDDFASLFVIPIFIPVIGLTASLMFHYDYKVKVENLNQISQWHYDGTNFLSSVEDKADDLKRKKTDRVKQLAPALTDAISEIEQNIKYNSDEEE